LAHLQEGTAVAKTPRSPQKEQTQRLKVYRAHQIVHDQAVRRRVSDQWLAAAVLVAATAVSGLGYWGWATIGPGAVDDVEQAEPVVTDPAPDADQPAGVPDIALSEFRNWEGEMVIDGVSVDLTLNGFLAPQAVANFLALSQDGFFDNTSCHRLTTEGIFVLQCGDPGGTGTGGPDYRFGPIENAPEDDVYERGVLAMARVGNDAQSMGSQFFIVYEDSPIPSDQAGGYTVFGEITAGLDQLQADVVDLGTVDGVSDGEPVAPAVISSITIR